MRKPARTCTKCIALRWFFMAAFPLIGMIYFQPEGAMRLAGRAPSIDMFAYMIVLACAALFALKWVAFKRQAQRVTQPVATRGSDQNESV